MNNGISTDSLNYIISRIIKNARELAEENDGSEFYDGKTLAYYEVLDILKSELEAHDQDLEALGLNVNLEKEFL